MAALIEVRSANERGISASLSPKLRPRRLVLDDGPVDDDALRGRARPFDEADRDLPAAAGLDGVEDALVAQGCRIAVTLELEFWAVDAARDVGGQHQQEIDLFGGAGMRGKAEQRGGG